MKRLQLAAVLGCGAAMFTLFSCSGSGSGENKGGDSTATDTSTAQTTPMQPVNTTITTPQNMVVVMQHVKDFAKWKVVYDGHDTARVSHGLHNYVIGRGLKDTNMVLVALKADDLDKARAFAKDPGLKAAMIKGGVIGAPTIMFTTMTFQDTATLDPNTIRSRATATVKDWAAWEKQFLSQKQERMDNGLLLRAYGHDASNDKQITVVTALSDTAKAFAYWKSDTFKKARAAGGVVGQPNRFLYTIAAKY